MVRIKMLCTYASPSLIMHPGKCYKVNDELAEELLNGGGPDGSGAATIAPDSAKLVKVPATPDPGDGKDNDVDD